AVGADATVVLLSDHGFAPCARRFYPNTWLEQRRLLVRRGRPGLNLGQRLRRLPFLRSLKRHLPALASLGTSSPPFAQFTAVEWPQTRAVYSPAGGIRFNIRGREPAGVLSRADARALADDLTAELLELTDPLTGASALAAVFPREELYSGPYVERAPDLILEPQRNSGNPACNIAIPSRFAVSATGSPFANSQELTGNHDLDGILLAAGPGIPPARLADARLIDIAPTLLHALGLPVPEDMEGRVLPLWETPPDVRRAGRLQGPDDRAAAGTYDRQEETLVEERLRSLGYL
ncbi:MAG: hypothetical protein D6775_01590, partial [Caldilineae bacterium]